MDIPMNQRPCGALGCDRMARKVGLCGRHYAHKRRTGDENTPNVWTWALDRLCVVCGSPVEPGTGRRRACSGSCQVILSWHGGTPPDRERPCALCGTTIDLLAKNKNGRRKRSDTKLCDQCKRGVRSRHGASVGQLAMRDGTDCRICGEPVDMSLTKLTSLFAPSVDHIIPYSKGGTHDLANLQLSHLWCNQVKHATLGFDLLLPGGSS